MASHMVFCGSRVVVQHVHQHLQEAADHEGIRGSRARRVSEEQLIDEHVRSTRVCPGCTLRPNSFLPLGVLRSIQRMHACYFFFYLRYPTLLPHFNEPGELPRDRTPVQPQVRQALMPPGYKPLGMHACYHHHLSLSLSPCLSLEHGSKGERDERWSDEGEQL
jgi:hypothetical protein